MTYAGVCYDGPQEGQIVTSNTPWFYIACYSHMPGKLYQFDMNASAPNHTYRWSHPLRKWVFEWN